LQQPDQREILSRLISASVPELRSAWREAARADDIATMHITALGNAALEAVARWLASGSAERLSGMVSAPPWNGNEGGADAPSTLLVSLGAALRELASGAPGTSAAADDALAAISAALDAHYRETVRRLEERVATDSLTGVSSREQILKRLSAECARAVRHGRPLGVVYIDADRLKQVNDQRGHDAGDEVLRTVGRVIVQNTRVADEVGRMGGDEFLLVLPETGLAGARSAANKITELLAAEDVEITAGVAATPDTRPEPDDLVSSADADMRAARSSRSR
jgi:diguanylate cyclase (GGDEF)-like protein